MTTRGRSRALPSDPRDRILRAALDVFSARGYRGGSLTIIAETAGLTRAGVLHHFPSKEAVLLALLELRDAELEVATPQSGRTLLELLAELDQLVAATIANRRMVQLAHILTAEASGEEHPARAWVARRYTRLRAILADAARLSMDKGELSPELDPNALAALILGAVEGAENQWLVDPERVDPVQVIRQLHWLFHVSAADPAPASAPE
jgi:AcrR family transcriptional regulator